VRRVAFLIFSSALFACSGDGRTKTAAGTVNTTAVEASNLFLLDDLKDGRKTSEVAAADANALKSVSDWITSFITQPNKEIGRPGPVCPFVPTALQAKTLWLTPEHIAGKGPSDVIQLTKDYEQRLLSIPPTEGDAANFKTFVVVFSDLSPDRAKSVFDTVLKSVAKSSYADNGIVVGAFYKGNDGTALYNSAFEPFQSPVPFLLIRRAVVSDWKFFLNNDEMLRLWAKRFGESGTLALAEELRRLPWNAKQK
jgi:hypothetical protein